jgi:hypothetical protein
MIATLKQVLGEVLVTCAECGDKSVMSDASVLGHGVTFLCERCTLDFTCNECGALEHSPLMRMYGICKSCEEDSHLIAKIHHQYEIKELRSQLTDARYDAAIWQRRYDEATQALEAARSDADGWQTQCMKGGL